MHIMLSAIWATIFRGEACRIVTCSALHAEVDTDTHSIQLTFTDATVLGMSRLQDASRYGMHLNMRVLPMPYGHDGAISRPGCDFQVIWTAGLFNHETVIPCS